MCIVKLRKSANKMCSEGKVRTSLSAQPAMDQGKDQSTITNPWHFHSHRTKASRPQPSPRREIVHPKAQRQGILSPSREAFQDIEPPTPPSQPQITNPACHPLPLPQGADQYDGTRSPRVSGIASVGFELLPRAEFG